MKLQFLKGALRGEAAHLIKHLTITDGNFIEAWSKLVSRYDKKKQIVSEYIRTFMTQSNCNVSVQSGSYISSLRKISDTSDQIIRGIKVLGEEASHRDSWLIYILLTKVDSETRRAWAEATTDDEFPKFSSFITFLNNRCDALETFEPVNRKSNSNTVVRNFHLTTQVCIKCRQAHPIFKCPEYKTMKLPEKREFVKSNNLCFNCLTVGHSVRHCTSKFRCHYCNQSHHSSLHNHQPDVQPRMSVTNSSNTSKLNHDTPSFTSSPGQSNSRVDSYTLVKTNINSITLLPTALVKIADTAGSFQLCRILLDSGSQATFISEECVQRLGLKRENARLLIHGLNSIKNAITRGKVHVSLKSRVYEHELNVQAYVLDKLTAPQPSRNLCLNIQHIVNNYKLADPYFYISQKIDMILGADYFMRVLQQGQQIISTELPPLQNTVFGYIVSGPMSSESITSNNILSCHADITDIDHLLRQFWEIESIPQHELEYTEDEQICESLFVKTHSIDPISQRYVVRLPFKDNIPRLGSSLPLALSCQNSLEHKFQHNADLYTSYSEFMNEYKDLGHMQQISDSLIDPGCEHMYLPHHAVIKMSSATTKVRVVFNGSAHTSNGYSLNHKLLVGPKTQRDLHQVLLTFRSFKVALVADIEKMYRQILVDPRDRNFQRIVWRSNQTEPVQHYWLTTVTYGTSAAPYLATRSLKQLTMEFQGQYPLAKQAVLNNFYVDDFLGGANDEEEALTVYQELTSLLQKRGFILRKWASNSTKIIHHMKGSNTQGSCKLITEKSDSIKVLGLIWNPENDCFSFDVNLPNNMIATKRGMLSEISRIFDPLGLISPVIISFKILLQYLWLKQYGWDEHCTDILGKWSQLRSELSLLHNIQIPRFIHVANSSTEIHGFADASEAAYAAVVYCRILDHNNVPTITIIASKTRVCPIKQISIPRLELCAAVLLTRLMKYIKSNLFISDRDCYAWTDSTVVLSWLSSPPRKWKSFIANRTSEILDSLPRSHWNHVSSGDNPADLASRGISTRQLIDSSLWWSGPQWLKTNWKEVKHHHPPLDNELVNKERRERYMEIFQLDVAETVLSILFTRFSSLTTIIHILSRCFQFVRRCKSIKSSTECNPLGIMASDVYKAYRSCVLWAQSEAFFKEINDIKTNHQLRPSSSLTSLTPFIDEHGMLRVGGRLTNSSTSFDTRHPIILPKHHIFTTHLVKQLHERYFHAGVSLLISIIRQKYWIISCRTVVKTCINKCLTCIRQRARTSQQIMADLPKTRVNAFRAFENVGVDYAGPILLLNRRGRGSRTFKAYIVLFVCFSTRAIHLELAGDLTSETFIACLKRFSSRRGIPATIYSDNGTNFVGAHRILSETQRMLQSLHQNEVISKFVADNNITWKFNPPSAPHFGGLWEAGVKSVKTILTRVISNTHLTYEEMLTVLVQIEGLLNSRPLIPVNDDISCLDALTPAHFIIGQPLTSLPDMSTNQTNSSIRERWRMTQRIQLDFWKRWHLEYLSSLQRRPKWQQIKENLIPGDMVVIKDPNLQPTQWLLGRIKETHQGTDNLVRVATVSTASGEIKRPITRLCKLPVADS